MLQSYLYITQRGLGTKMSFIGGCLMARNHTEAYNNARILVKERKGLMLHLSVNQMVSNPFTCK